VRQVPGLERLLRGPDDRAVEAVAVREHIAQREDKETERQTS
jgi:hypothetical protein